MHKFTFIFHHPAFIFPAKIPLLSDSQCPAMKLQMSHFQETKRTQIIDCNKQGEKSPNRAYT